MDHSSFSWKNRGETPTLKGCSSQQCKCPLSGVPPLLKGKAQLNGLSHPSQLGSTHWPTLAPWLCCSCTVHFKCTTDGPRAFACPFVTQAPSGRVAMYVSAQTVKHKNHRRTECNMVLIWLLCACQRVTSHSRYRTSHGCHHSLHESEISADLHALVQFF